MKLYKGCCGLNEVCAFLKVEAFQGHGDSFLFLVTLFKDQGTHLQKSISDEIFKISVALFYNHDRTPQLFESSFFSIATAF